MAHKGYHSEHEIAKRLKAKRIGGPGNMDIDGGWFSAEVKQMVFPGWLHHVRNQARRLAREGQLPLVILHEKGMFYERSYVMLSLKDFLEWFGDATEQRTPCGS